MEYFWDAIAAFDLAVSATSLANSFMFLSQPAQPNNILTPPKIQLLQTAKPGGINYSRELSKKCVPIESKHTY